MILPPPKYVAKVSGQQGVLREQEFDRLIEAMNSLKTDLGIAGAERCEIHFKGALVWTKTLRRSESRDAFRQRDVESLLRKLANMDGDSPLFTSHEDDERS